MSPSSNAATLTASSGDATPAPSSGFDATPAPSSGFDATPAPSSGYDATPASGDTSQQEAQPQQPGLIRSALGSATDEAKEILHDIYGEAYQSTVLTPLEMLNRGQMPFMEGVPINPLALMKKAPVVSTGLQQAIEDARQQTAPTGHIGTWIQRAGELYALHKAFGAAGLDGELMKMSGADQWDATEGLRKIVERKDITGRLVNYALSAITNAGRWGLESGGQEFAHSADIKQAERAGVGGAVAGAVLGPPGEAALQYVANVRSGALPKLSGLIESILEPEGTAPKPVRPMRPAYPPPPVPPEEITTEAQRMPPPPELIRPPGKPIKPAPLPATERPSPPIRPAPIPRPAAVEPTPVPEAPAEPEPYAPERAPAEERLAAQQAQMARETVAEKFAREAQQRAGEIGDPTEAATHLENLNKEIEDEGFANLPADRQAQILEARQELLRRAQPAADPRSASEMMDGINDMGDAVKALRRRAVAAYQEWNEQSGGKFNQFNDVFSKTRGKFDADSIQKRNEAEAGLMNLWEKQKIASPIDRAVYRSQFADSYVLEDADKAFTNAFEGADRTGDLNPKALQRNWKSYVNKNGVERVKSVLGEDRYNSMNQFVNDMAGEDEADKAINRQIRAEYERKQAEHIAIVKNAKTLDEARQAAQDAKWESDVAEQQATYQGARQEAQQGIRQARIQDRLNRAQQLTEYQKAHETWQNKVMEARDLNTAKRAAHLAEQQRVRDFNQAIEEAKGARKATMIEQRQKWAEMKGDINLRHAEALSQYNDELADWRATQDGARRKQMYIALGKAATGMTRPWKLAWGIATNPIAQHVVAHAAAVGMRPEAILPVVQSLVQQRTTPAPAAETPKKKQPTGNEVGVPGMTEEGNIDVNHRPVIWNDDGTPSTIYSATIPIGNGKWALVPTIADGRFLTPNGKMPKEGDDKAARTLEAEATKQYNRTHEHLGIFNSQESADAYAERTHGWMPNGGPEKVYTPSYSGESNMPLTRKEYERALARR